MPRRQRDRTGQVDVRPCAHHPSVRSACALLLGLGDHAVAHLPSQAERQLPRFARRGRAHVVDAPPGRREVAAAR
eukprot:1915740-Prymnesium_polylepis.2